MSIAFIVVLILLDCHILQANTIISSLHHLVGLFLLNCYFSGTILLTFESSLLSWLVLYATLISFYYFELFLSLPFKLIDVKLISIFHKERPHGAVANVEDWKFELQLRYYVHFWKSMNPIILLAMC